MGDIGKVISKVDWVTCSLPRQIEASPTSKPEAPDSDSLVILAPLLVSHIAIAGLVLNIPSPLLSYYQELSSIFSTTTFRKVVAPQLAETL